MRRRSDVNFLAPLVVAQSGAVIGAGLDAPKYSPLLFGPAWA